MAAKTGPSREVARAFERIATNVAVVTAPGPYGCTANVWAEGPEPPVLLITLRRAGATRARVVEAGRFAVSMLAEGQADVARRFAGPPEYRFAGGRYSEGPRGLPLLDGAVAGLECRVRDTHWFGDHEIIVGDVESATVGGADRRPLLFCSGEFLVGVPGECGA